LVRKTLIEEHTLNCYHCLRRRWQRNTNAKSPLYETCGLSASLVQLWLRQWLVDIGDVEYFSGPVREAIRHLDPNFDVGEPEGKPEVSRGGLTHDPREIARAQGGVARRIERGELAADFTYLGIAQRSATGT
jgi:hypothetical protein